MAVASMKVRYSATLSALLLAVATDSAVAVLDVDGAAGSSSFQRQLRTALTLLERSEEPHIRQLYAAVVAAPGTITFRQMTDDRATWSNDGDPDRGHTEPADGRPKREGRTQPTNATIFIPEAAVKPGSARWKSGLLVHELVHALDLADGRYNRDYTVRERRAVFMQNIWRQHVRYQLRAISRCIRYRGLSVRCAAGNDCGIRELPIHAARLSEAASGGPANRQKH